MFGSTSLAGRDLRVRSKDSGRVRRRRANRRLQVGVDVLRLEERWMLNGTAELHIAGHAFKAVVQGDHSSRAIESVAVHRDRRQAAQTSARRVIRSVPSQSSLQRRAPVHHHLERRPGHARRLPGI